MIFIGCSKSSTASVQTYRHYHCKTLLDRSIILTHDAVGPFIVPLMLITAAILVLMQQSKNHLE